MIQRAPLARPLAATLLLLGLAGNAGAQPPPLAPEVRLTGAGHCPGLAGRPDGTFAVAWMGVLPPERTTMTVQAGDLGGGLGSQHLVSIEATGLTGDTAIAATAAGYTVAWQIVQGEGVPGRPSRFPHLALRTDLSGSPLGDPLHLHRQSIGVSPRPVGGFVNHWQKAFGARVYVQLLDAAGQAVSPPVRQSARGAVWSGVAHRPEGGFVLYWNEQTTTTPNRNGGIFGRRFADSGRPVGKVFPLVPAGGRPLTRDLFRLAVAPDGTLAAVWAFAPAADEGGRQGLRASLLDRQGTPLGPTLEIMGAAARPELWFVPGGPAIDPAGHTLVTGVEIDGEQLRARAQPLTPAGTLAGPSFELTTSPGQQGIFCPAAAAVGDAWLVAWYSTATGEVFIRPFSR